MSLEGETTHAVIDRVVDDVNAVLLVGDDELEFVVDASRLPSQASPGDWLQVTVVDGELVSIDVDPDATEKARVRIESKLDLLRQRGRKSRCGSDDPTHWTVD